MLYSGIDLHKRSVVIHTVHDAGTTVREASLPTSSPAVAAYFRTLSDTHRAVVECTGTWYWMRDLVATEGMDLRLGHTKYLKAIIYAAELPELPRLKVTWQEEQAALLTQQVKALDRLLRHQLIPTPEAQRLVWVPGIGATVAATLLLEIDDIARFPSVRQFHLYCRLVPGADNSGRKTRHTRSKDGNRSRKLAFHHAAVNTVRHAPETATFHRRWVRRKGARIVRALVAKELATIASTILSNQEDYNRHFKGQPIAYRKQTQWPRLTSPLS